MLEVERSISILNPPQRAIAVFQNKLVLRITFSDVEVFNGDGFTRAECDNQILINACQLTYLLTRHRQFHDRRRTERNFRGFNICGNAS